MRVGDLVKVVPCSRDKVECECFFCAHDSNRVGLVLAEQHISPDQSGFRSGWQVLFDCGKWEVFPSDVRNGNIKVIGSDEKKNTR